MQIDCDRLFEQSQSLKYVLFRYRIIDRRGNYALDVPTNASVERRPLGLRRICRPARRQRTGSRETGQRLVYRRRAARVTDRGGRLPGRRGPGACEIAGWAAAVNLARTQSCRSGIDRRRGRGRRVPPALIPLALTALMGTEWAVRKTGSAVLPEMPDQIIVGAVRGFL